MWFKKNRPAPEAVLPRDDIEEARAARAEAQSGLIKVREQESFVRAISNIMIDRQGRNHYMELLYTHIPGGAS